MTATQRQKKRYRGRKAERPMVRYVRFPMEKLVLLFLLRLLIWVANQVILMPRFHCGVEHLRIVT